MKAFCAYYLIYVILYIRSNWGEPMQLGLEKADSTTNICTIYSPKVTTKQVQYILYSIPFHPVQKNKTLVNQNKTYKCEILTNA